MTTETTVPTKPLTARQLRRKVGTRTTRAQYRKVMQWQKDKQPRNTK